MAGLRVTTLVTLMACLPVGAQQDSRLLEHIVSRRQVALVIGNSGYLAGSELKNPVNDARAMAAELRRLQFDVTELHNLTHLEMGRAIDQFATKLQRDDFGFFYFAGHGVQVQSKNYLVPVDFTSRSEVDVPHLTYSADQVRDKMEYSGARLRVIVLNACRNNPFRGQRAQGGGLAPMKPAEGTIIAYATGDNSVADDNPRESNGLFTKQLLQALRTQGAHLKEIFETTKFNVYTESARKQRPAIYDEVFGRYYFASAANKPPPPKVEPRIAPIDPPPTQPSAVAPPKTEPRPLVVDAPPSSLPAVGAVRENPRDGLKYVWIPAGRFQMGCSPGDSECDGDEKPAREVEITRGFWMGQTEVTQAAYRKVIGMNLSGFKGPLPVKQVNWTEANAFCAAVGMRLPTEAEWEYAARGGSAGSRYGEVAAVAWYDGKSGGQTHPVGEKQANGYGLYDILGNVWEWVADWHDEKYYAGGVARDPQGPTSGKYRALRGGSGNYTARFARVSSRARYGVSIRFRNIGFRCVGELR